jgi:uncharacterized protein
MRKYPKLFNPFPLVGYNGPEYFCDREEEMGKLSSAIANGRNISLIARRRIGKSSLVEHLKYTLESSHKGWKVFFIDMIKTSTLDDLYKVLAKELFESRGKGVFSKLSDMDMMSRLKMSIGVNPLTQLPELSLEIKESQTKHSLSGLLDWIAKEKNVLIVFDEFQQILSYPQENTEGYLRSEMMRLPNVRFIFCGGDQHLLDDMFRNHARSFYNSTQMMDLNHIDPAVYVPYIKKKFTQAKRTISEEAVNYLLHVASDETYVIQKLCNAIFESGLAHVTLPIAKEIFIKVLLEHQRYFERIRTLLGASSVQFKLLRAISKQDMVFEPTGKTFMQAYGFSNSSSVLKSFKSLEGYNLISKVIVEGKGFGYYVNDALFRAWLNTLPV